MTSTAPLHRSRPSAIAAIATLVCTLLLGLATPAGAQQPTTPPNESGTDKVQTLRSNLESAAAGYIEAEAQLETARAKQVELQEKLTIAELEIARMRAGVARYAGEVYKTGRVRSLTVLLNATSPDEVLGRAVAINKITERDQTQLYQLADARKRAADAKAGIDAVIAEQEAAKAEMEKRRLAAERSLSAMGSYAINGWMDPNSPAAKPAPRTASGGWPKEYCTINDPTTGGCITPRTLHMYKETKANGFGRFVSCYRPGGPYEHPKGRACDWSAFPSGFNDSNAGGDDRLYGDKLASFYVKNASAFGVMYVVWYCKIWIAGGWKSYSSTGSKCGDSPAGDHTNHVHVSIY